MNGEDTTTPQTQGQDTVPVQNQATGAVRRIPRGELQFAIRYHGAKEISETQYSAGMSKFGKPPAAPTATGPAAKPSAGLDASGKPLYSIPGKAGAVLSDKPPLSQQQQPPVAAAGGTGAPPPQQQQQDFGPGYGMAQMLLGGGKQLGREAINLAQMADPSMGGIKAAMQTGPGQALAGALKPEGSMQQFGGDAADVLEYMIPVGGEEKLAVKAGELVERFAPKLVGAIERKAAESGIIGIITRQGTKQAEQIVKSVYQAVTGAATGAVQGRDPAQSAKDAAVTSMVLGNLGRLSSPIIKSLFNVKDIRGGDVGKKLLDIAGVTRKKLAESSTKELQKVEGKITSALTKAGGPGKVLNVQIQSMLDTIEKKTFDPKILEGESKKIKQLLGDMERFSESVASGKVKILTAQRAQKIRQARTLADRLTTETNPTVIQGLQDAIKTRAEDVKRLTGVLSNQPAKVSANKINTFRKNLEEHYMPYGVPEANRSESEKAAAWVHKEMSGILSNNRPEVGQLLKDSHSLRDIQGSMLREERKSFGLHTIMDPSALPRTLPPWVAWEIGHKTGGPVLGLMGAVAAGGARAPMAAGAKALASPLSKGFATGVENIIGNPSSLSFGPEDPDEVKKKTPYGPME